MHRCFGPVPGVHRCLATDAVRRCSVVAAETTVLGRHTDVRDVRPVHRDCLASGVQFYTGCCLRCVFHYSHVSLVRSTGYFYGGSYQFSVASSSATATPASSASAAAPSTKTAAVRRNIETLKNSVYRTGCTTTRMISK